KCWKREMETDVVFHVPFVRHILLWYGAISVSKASLMKHLKNHENVGLLMDGIAGIFAQHNKRNKHLDHHFQQHDEIASAKSTSSFDSDSSSNERNNDATKNNGDVYAQIKKRTGIAKLALETGSNVIPGFGFGNANVFTAVFDNYGVLEWLSRKIRASLLVFYGRYGLPIPFRVPCYYVYGRVIENKYANHPIKHPTEGQIAELHEQILKGFQEMFDAHKHIYGYPNAKLVFV
ncbi:hypothetical protein RFI_11886, partial [Reticulomyxa filosa]